ncbi:MAG: hypothetical protein K2H20_03640 [Bacilli bacterium]|nr:hypothetical protein [Bacilli bacterium]
MIRESKELNEYNIILPHEFDDNSSNPRDFYKTIDLFIAEVSLAGTGLGIELGWVYDDNIPVYYIYEKGSKLSGSIRCVSNRFYEYSDDESLVNVLLEIINDWKENYDNKKISDIIENN